MKSIYPIFMLVPIALLLLFLWGADHKSLADLASTRVTMAPTEPTPTPCLPTIPCGLGFHWDTKLCQCVSDTPQGIMPQAVLPTPTQAIPQAMRPTPCAPFVPCGMGYHWNTELCQCDPDRPPRPVPSVALPVPTPIYYK